MVFLEKNIDPSLKQSIICKRVFYLRFWSLYPMCLCTWLQASSLHFVTRTPCLFLPSSTYISCKCLYLSISQILSSLAVMVLCSSLQLSSSDPVVGNCTYTSSTLLQTPQTTSLKNPQKPHLKKPKNKKPNKTHKRSLRFGGFIMFYDIFLSEQFTSLTVLAIMK